MKVTSRKFNPPLKTEDLGGGVEIRVRAIKTGSTGAETAQVEFWNGEKKHSDWIDPSLEKDRKKFIAAALTAVPEASECNLKGALLDLPDRIKQHLEELGADEEGGEECSAGGKEAAAGRLVSLVMSAGAVPFNWDDKAFVSIEVNGHIETWPLTSKGFKRWMKHRFYEAEEGGVPNAQAVQDALGVLDGKAFYDGPKLPVFVRISDQIDGAIYLDLVNDDWEAVEITASGWRVVKNPPVRFLRTKGMQPLPYPVKGGSVSDLKRFINVEDDEDFYLLAAWVIGAFCPHGAKTGVELCGEQGSAKTTGARAMRRTIDPNIGDLRRPPKEELDLMVAAAKSLVVGFDNLTNIQQWLSDSLCCLSTGSALSKRELYSDDDEVLLVARRPAIVTGIGETVNAPDLVDRYIKILLRVLGDDERKSEEEFWADFEAAHPKILGAILGAVSVAMKNLPAVKLERTPRMADFARWMVAAEPALGWKTGTFLAAYENNRSEAVAAGLEASPIGHAVIDFIKAQPDNQWSGTMKGLLETLNDRAGEEKRLPRDWPKKPRGLSSDLRRVAPCLRAEGVVYTPPPKKERKEKPIHTLKWTPKPAPVPPSPASDGGRLTLADIGVSPMSGVGGGPEDPGSGTKSAGSGRPADIADIPDVVTPTCLKAGVSDPSLFAPAGSDEGLDDDVMDGPPYAESNAPDPFEQEPSPWR